MAGKTLNPKSMAAPLGAYSHAVCNDGAGRLLHISGQVGIQPDGKLAEGLEGQIETVWKNIATLLHEAGMDVSDLSKITTYVTDSAALKQASEVRATYLGDHRPASTALVVQALANPEWLVEIDATAFRSGALPSSHHSRE